MSGRRQRVAVVGSGAGGMGAMYALRHAEHCEVHLFEAAKEWGGHIHTHRYEKDGLRAGVDFGFIGFNPATYPNFTAAVRDLGLELNHPPNSLGISRGYGALEWSTDRVFAQPSNLLRPSFWRMLFDIIRFNNTSLDILIEEAEEKASGVVTERRLETLRQYLARENYSEQFREDYLVPMTRLIWLMEMEQTRSDLPVRMLIRYMWNHHFLITLAKGHDWYSIKGGSRTYLEAILHSYPDNQLHLNSPVLSVRNRDNSDGQGRLAVEIGSPDGSRRIEFFDHVILACHAPQILQILGPEATEEEKRILGAFKTTTKDIVFHSDTSVMPNRRSAWSCWNHKDSGDPKSVKQMDDPQQWTSCWINLAMNIPEDKFGPLFTTTPPEGVDPSRIHARWTASHPWFTPEAVSSQELIPSIQNKRGISYAGAWMGYGAHEDGFSAGLRAAVEHVGAKVPFEIRDARFVEGVIPKYGFWDHVIRFIIRIIQSLIMLWVGKVSTDTGSS